MNAQTSDRLSTIASHYADISPDMIRALAQNESSRIQLAAQIRQMAMSLVRQDETRGLRGLVRKVRSVLKKEKTP
jgi:UTP-glucose-1-phosphate uridylyltransferase